VAFLSAVDSLVVQDPVPPCLEGYIGREGEEGEAVEEEEDDDTEENVPTYANRARTEVNLLVMGLCAWSSTETHDEFWPRMAIWPREGSDRRNSPHLDHTRAEQPPDVVHRRSPPLG
jgi:hypothetical protein